MQKADIIIIDGDKILAQRVEHGIGYAFQHTVQGTVEWTSFNFGEESSKEYGVTLTVEGLTPSEFRTLLHYVKVALRIGWGLEVIIELP